MVGIDEVGRGCLAGPLLVVAARPKTELPGGLKDSKQLSRAQREAFYKQLLRTCEWGQGWVSAAEINKIGLAGALKLAVKRALSDLSVDIREEVIMDGVVNYIPVKYKNSRCQAKADNTYPIVSAASILAKVMRDNFMRELAAYHPQYGFEQHVGYGTKYHLAAIQNLGVLEGVHRTIFANFTKVIT